MAASLYPSSDKSRVHHQACCFSHCFCYEISRLAREATRVTSNLSEQNAEKLAERISLLSSEELDVLSIQMGPRRNLHLLNLALMGLDKTKCSADRIRILRENLALSLNLVSGSSEEK